MNRELSCTTSKEEVIRIPRIKKPYTHLHVLIAYNFFKPQDADYQFFTKYHHLYLLLAWVALFLLLFYMVVSCFVVVNGENIYRASDDNK